VTLEHPFCQAPMLPQKLLIRSKEGSTLPLRMWRASTLAWAELLHSWKGNSVAPRCGVRCAAKGGAVTNISRAAESGKGRPPRSGRQRTSSRDAASGSISPLVLSSCVRDGATAAGRGRRIVSPTIQPVIRPAGSPRSGREDRVCSTEYTERYDTGIRRYKCSLRRAVRLKLLRWLEGQVNPAEGARRRRRAPTSFWDSGSPVCMCM
jgi:hypothetical protein